MKYPVSPAQRLQGSVRLPGDKSISHRYAMIASVAEGVTRISNYSTGADCHSTLGCMQALGVPIEKDGTNITIHGQGLDGLRAPAAELDAGNSGSTIRMLSGMLAAQPFESTIIGDESLSQRPMQRIMKPLAEMGARIEARDGKFPPLRIRGATLQPIEYDPPVASAQVKTCVLFAGLHTKGVTGVYERTPTRDHTEVALREFGAEIGRSGDLITIEGRPTLTGRELAVPGDLSSSAFFLVAASIIPGARIRIEGVGLSPSRVQLLDWLAAVGANVRIVQVASVAGEMVGTIEASYAPVRGGLIEGATTAGVIDEIPVLAVLGALSSEGLIVRDAGELRVKETDRIATVAENLRRMGATVHVSDTGFEVPGNQKLHGAELDSFGDHRIAMAFTVAALAASGSSAMLNADAASVSFPEFYSTIEALQN